MAHLGLSSNSRLDCLQSIRGQERAQPPFAPLLRMIISPTLLQLTFTSASPPFPFGEPVSSLPSPLPSLALAVAILQTMPKHLASLAASQRIPTLPTSL